MGHVCTQVAQFFLGTLSQTDRWFALLRGVVFLGGIGWLLFVPLQPQQWVILAALLGAFSLYSGGLYALTFLRPARIRTYYLCVFIVDLLIITALNDYVGEVKGSFYLAYYLLVALHAYYFGLGMGLIVAGLASVLYVMSDYPEFQTIVWHEYTLRIAFLFLVATFLGLLAEKDKGDKQHMESLNRELSEKTRKLELAYIQLAEAQRQIIQTEKLSSLGTLVAGVAHEINNPIGIIANRVEVLRLEHEEQGLDDTLKEDLEVIHRQAHRVAEITTALLAYARQSSHEQTLLDLNAVVRSALLLWQPQAEQVVRVETVLNEPLPPIMGNVTQLQQVVINLLSNALDATPHWGHDRCVDAESGRAPVNRGAGGHRHGDRYPSGASLQGLRSIFYHQTPWERHGAWALGVLWHRPGSSWYDHRRQPGRSWLHLYRYFTRDPAC